MLKLFHRVQQYWPQHQLQVKVLFNGFLQLFQLFYYNKLQSIFRKPFDESSSPGGTWAENDTPKLLEEHVRVDL